MGVLWGWAFFCERGTLVERIAMTRHAATAATRAHLRLPALSRSLALSRSRSPTISFSLALSHCRSLSLSLSISHSALSLYRSLSLSLSLFHTHSQTHDHKAHTLSLSLSLTSAWRAKRAVARDHSGHVPPWSRDRFRGPGARRRCCGMASTATPTSPICTGVPRP
jgi:hypothetical protein